MEIKEVCITDIICGDSAEVLKTLPDASIDLTVTSPPYDNLRTYKGFVFDFETIAQELYRVTKPGGVVVWVVADATIKGSETGTSFRQALYFKDVCGFNLHDTMIWVKDGGGAHGSNMCYFQNTEYMFVLSKGKPAAVNLLRDKPNMSYGKLKSRCGRRKANGEVKDERHFCDNQYSRRNNWWLIPTANNGGLHPAVFPVNLAEDHILSWSNPGDVVLDPFMGSGTTGVAAVRTGREFIGIEIAQEYADMARDRIGRAGAM